MNVCFIYSSFHFTEISTHSTVSVQSVQYNDFISVHHQVMTTEGLVKGKCQFKESGTLQSSGHEGVTLHGGFSPSQDQARSLHSEPACRDSADDKALAPGKAGHSLGAGHRLRDLDRTQASCDLGP